MYVFFFFHTLDWQSVVSMCGNKGEEVKKKKVQRGKGRGEEKASEFSI